MKRFTENFRRVFPRGFVLLIVLLLFASGCSDVYYMLKTSADSRWAEARALRIQAQKETKEALEKGISKGEFKGEKWILPSGECDEIWIGRVESCGFMNDSGNCFVTLYHAVCLYSFERDEPGKESFLTMEGHILQFPHQRFPEEGQWVLAAVTRSKVPEDDTVCMENAVDAQFDSSGNLILLSRCTLPRKFVQALLDIDPKTKIHFAKDDARGTGSLLDGRVSFDFRELFFADIAAEPVTR